MKTVVAAVLCCATVTATACSSSQSPEDLAAACERFGDDMSGLDLDTTPTAEEAEKTAESLDARLSEIRDSKAHDAVVELHSSLHALERAVDRGDDQHAAEVLEDVRQSARDAAQACDLDPSRLGL